MIHNHGPNKGLGLNCPEYVIDEKRIGQCLLPSEVEYDSHNSDED